MSTITLKFLIVLIVFLKLNTCAFANSKLIRLIRQSSNKQSTEFSQIDNKYSSDKLDRLQTKEQNLNSILTSYELNENIEENTKSVINWTPETYPNPFIDYKNCSLKERGYICDPDDILEEDDINKLRESIEGLNENLDNHCVHTNGKQGIDFGIAIMNQFQPIENKTLRDTAKEYAEKLRHKWQLGGECDNGLLILQSSKDSILTFSMGKTTLKLIKNVTINTLNLNFVDTVSMNENNNQPLGQQLQETLLKISNGLSFVNKDKALNKLNIIANNNPKVGNALRNVAANLDRQIEEDEKEHQKELNATNNDKSYNGINGELLLIYFLLFVLMLTIACFILGVFLRKRLGDSTNPTLNSTTDAHQSINKQTSNEQKTTVQERIKYQKIPTNNTINQNLNK